MISTEFIIPYTYGDTVKIKPLFDIHCGNKGFNEYALKKYLEDDTDDLTYFFGGGDLVDSIVVTDKRYAKDMDGMNGMEIIDEQIEKLFRILEPYREKIIGLGIGNHESVLRKKAGTNPAKRLATMLSTDDHEVKYLGYSGFIRLLIRDPVSARNREIIIRWHHGWGSGGRTLGTSMTKYGKDIPHYDADIYLYGHDHQRKADKIIVKRVSGKKVLTQRKVIATCGTYLETFVTGEEVLYSEEKGYAPLELGGIVVHIMPRRRGSDIWIVDK